MTSEAQRKEQSESQVKERAEARIEERRESKTKEQIAFQRKPQPEVQNRRQRERYNQVGFRILKDCRGILYGNYPMLDGGLAALTPEVSTEISAIGTDGERLFFAPEFLIRIYRENPETMVRGYLHLLLHCLFFHLERPMQYEETLWNAACDLAAEQVAEREWSRSRTEAFYETGNRSEAPYEITSEPLGMGGKAERSLEIRRNRRREILQALGPEILSAEQICEWICRDSSAFCVDEIVDLFAFDDHRLWKTMPKNQSRVHRIWEKIGREAGTGGKRIGGTAVGSAGGSYQEMIAVQKTQKGEYRRFLKQFAVLREEQKLDQENFDLIYYNYGMEHYGDIPLMEPLEYSEVNRLEELVIAIDTSGSCSTEMVEQFLAETYAILAEKENFFEKMNVYVVQCDCCIQKVLQVTSRAMWESCGRQIEIQGRGGTDFRPVFRLIEELQKRKALKQLKALIYFTDGVGIYPEQKPEYEVLFVSAKKSERQIYTPGWVRQINLEEKE